MEDEEKKTDLKRRKFNYENLSDLKKSKMSDEEFEKNRKENPNPFGNKQVRKNDIRDKGKSYEKNKWTTRKTQDEYEDDREDWFLKIGKTDKKEFKDHLKKTPSHYRNIDEVPKDAWNSSGNKDEFFKGALKVAKASNIDYKTILKFMLKGSSSAMYINTLDSNLKDAKKNSSAEAEEKRRKFINKYSTIENFYRHANTYEKTEFIVSVLALVKEQAKREEKETIRRTFLSKPAKARTPEENKNVNILVKLYRKVQELLKSQSLSSANKAKREVRVTTNKRAERV